MTKALTPADRLKGALAHTDVKKQFQNALGKHADLFTASLLDVYNDGLQNCEPKLVIQEALKAAVLRLPISKGLGFAYIVPYKGKPQFQIGYKGIIQLAMRSGQVKNLNAGPVYEGEYQGFNKLSGELDLTGKKQSDKEVGYFAYMELINGFKKCEYWTKEEITDHAKKHSASYGSKSAPWFKHFSAMATKTVLKSMLSKYAPMSIDFVQAMSQDDMQMEQPEIKDITPPGMEDKKELPKPDSAKNAHTEQKNEVPPPDEDTQFFEQQSEQLGGDPGF